MKEGGAGECPAGALFRVALCAQQAAVRSGQTSTTLILNEITMLCPQLP